MKTHAEINQLKYELENRTLREWSLRYGIVDLACLISVYPEMYLGGVYIDRRKITLNDRVVINKVIDWMTAKKINF